MKDSNGLPPNEVIGVVFGTAVGMATSLYLYGPTFSSGRIFAMTLALTMLTGVLGYQLSRREISRTTVFALVAILSILHTG